MLPTYFHSAIYEVVFVAHYQLLSLTSEIKNLMEDHDYVVGMLKWCLL